MGGSYPHGSASRYHSRMFPALRARFPALALLGAEKSFAHPWVGHPTLNRLGLHVARIGLAHAAASVRRMRPEALRPPDALRILRRDGIVVLPGWLEKDAFERLRAEVRTRVAAIEAQTPVRPTIDRGFGPRRPFPGGVDRWDGDTLNRFITIDEAHTPLAAAVAREPRLARLCAIAAGARHHAEKISIYVTVHGPATDNSDPQKILHRDTFHAAIKLWYFIEDVHEDDGPFVYVPGSHRLTGARLRWEHARAVHACAPDQANKGGAFRIGQDELAALGLPGPRSVPARANTLVVADVRGFHRRGDARPGARRLALYASLRPSPFVPMAY